MGEWASPTVRCASPAVRRRRRRGFDCRARFGRATSSSKLGQKTSWCRLPHRPLIILRRCQPIAPMRYRVSPANTMIFAPGCDDFDICARRRSAFDVSWGLLFISWGRQGRRHAHGSAHGLHDKLLFAISTCCCAMPYIATSRLPSRMPTAPATLTQATILLRCRRMMR